MHELQVIKRPEKVFEDSDSNCESHEEIDTEWQPKEKRMATKTPSSRKRRVMFAKEAEISTKIDASLEEVQEKENYREARSTSVSSGLYEMASTASEASSLGVAEKMSVEVRKGASRTMSKLGIGLNQ